MAHNATGRQPQGSSIGAQVIRLLERSLRLDRAGVGLLLDEIEAGRPVPRRRVPDAATLIRQDREAR